MGDRHTDTASTIRIDYMRPPDRRQVFEQRLVERSPSGIITLLESASLAEPNEVDGDTILESGSAIVWFTFPGRWHDIGRFHTKSGRFTGYYANILSPVEFVTEEHWRTTDLFLDVWLRPGAEPVLLDEDELDRAESRGWISAADARAARREADRLLAGARQGSWPPTIVDEWTLDRARYAVGR